MPQRIETISLTPVLAAQLLASNTEDNRKHSKSHVVMLAEEMRRGRWHKTHQGLLIGKGGKLLDGQHRCMAVVASGATIETMIVYDDELETTKMLPVDIGFKRERAYILGISKHHSATADYIRQRVCANKGGASPAQTSPFAEWIRDEYLTIDVHKTKTFSQAPVCAAYILRMKETPRLIDWYAEQFKIVSTHKFHVFSPSISSYYKMFENGLRSQTDLFVMTYRALEYGAKSQVAVQPRDIPQSYTLLCNKFRQMFRATPFAENVDLPADVQPSNGLKSNGKLYAPDADLKLRKKEIVHDRL